MWLGQPNAKSTICDNTLFFKCFKRGRFGMVRHLVFENDSDGLELALAKRKVWYKILVFGADVHTVHKSAI